MKNRWLQGAIACSLLLLLVWISIFSFNLYRLYYQPMTLEESSEGVVRLDKSMTATSFAHTLKSQNLIKSERLFLTLVRTEGLSKKLKAGIYQVKAKETCLEFLRRVAAGDVIIESFKIIEGTTQRQVSENLAHAAYLTYDAADWLTIVPAYADGEGALLADTYHYNAGSQAKELLARAHANLQQFLDYSWEHRAQGLPYKSPYELLIVASILEKEAAIPSEKRVISGVIINRLNKHMRLQMDPTVIYALGSNFNGKLTHENMKIDSPYNSYRYQGLPPTPIAMVGKDAIDAAAHPQFTDFLYYVARGDGSHEFSATYDQQKAAIARYLKGVRQDEMNPPSSYTVQLQLTH